MLLFYKRKVFLSDRYFKYDINMPLNGFRKYDERE